MNVNLSPLEIDFLLRELQANQGMIAPSASIPAWYRHSIQETLRDALLAHRKQRVELQDQKIKALMEEEARQNQERLKQQLGQ